MADYFTRFSCLLDVGTIENAARALDIYNELMAQNATEDPLPSRFYFLSSRNMAPRGSGCAIPAPPTRSSSSPS